MGIKRQFLSEHINEATQGTLAGSIGSVTCDVAPDNGRDCDNKVAGLGLDGEFGVEPDAEDGEDELDTAVVVGVHHVAHLFHGHLHEEAGDRVASIAPDNVERLAIVPSCRFFEEGSRVVRDADIGRDVVKALLFGVFGCSLFKGSQNVSYDVYMVETGWV